jgi:hypothetical protein
MIPEIKIFIAQFSMIWLLGLQSINVNRGHKLIAALTSFALGIVGFYVTGTVASAYHEGMMSPMFISFILAGPCGILFSMYSHPYIVKFFGR